VNVHERPSSWALTMSEVTYLEAIRESAVQEMERDQNVFASRGHWRYGGAFQGHEGLMAKYGAGEWSTRRSRRRLSLCRGGCGSHGNAPGVRDAIHRFHLDRFTTC